MVPSRERGRQMEDANRTELSRVAQQSQTDLGDQTAVEAEANKAEMVTVLRVSRWDVRDGPFQGFDSPPGRF